MIWDIGLEHVRVLYNIQNVLQSSHECSLRHCVWFHKRQIYNVSTYHFNAILSQLLCTCLDSHTHRSVNNRTKQIVMKATRTCNAMFHYLECYNLMRNKPIIGLIIKAAIKVKLMHSFRSCEFYSKLKLNWFGDEILFSINLFLHWANWNLKLAKIRKSIFNNLH